jgi:hypothetical protein
MNGYGQTSKPQRGGGLIASASSYTHVSMWLSTPHTRVSVPHSPMYHLLMCPASMGGAAHDFSLSPSLLSLSSLPLVGALADMQPRPMGRHVEPEARPHLSQALGMVGGRQVCRDVVELHRAVVLPRVSIARQTACGAHGLLLLHRRVRDHVVDVQRRPSVTQPSAVVVRSRVLVPVVPVHVLRAAVGLEAAGMVAGAQQAGI